MRPAEVVLLLLAVAILALSGFILDAVSESRILLRECRSLLEAAPDENAFRAIIREEHERLLRLPPAVASQGGEPPSQDNARFRACPVGMGLPLARGGLVAARLASLVALAVF